MRTKEFSIGAKKLIAVAKLEGFGRYYCYPVSKVLRECEVYRLIGIVNARAFICADYEDIYIAIEEKDYLELLYRLSELLSG